jgi:four helix bundle protein
MEIPAYRKLIVWQKAHQNAVALIALLEKISFNYSKIVIQCITSATSIGANIAEGNACVSEKQKHSYFEISLSSSYELDNWLQILKDSKGIVSDKSVLNEIESRNIEVIKILTKLISRS